MRGERAAAVALYVLQNGASPLARGTGHLEAIAAMKTNTLFLRAKYRDYYDLYCLVKHGMSIRDIFTAAQGIVDGINYKLLCIALLYIDDIEDDNITYLIPKEVVSKQQIRTFFERHL